MNVDYLWDQQWEHSTSENITISLGATMGDHDLSWTSSMATPVSKDTVKKALADDCNCDHEQPRQRNFARRLFSSRTNHCADVGLIVSENDDCGVHSLLVDCGNYSNFKCSNKAAMSRHKERTTSDEILISLENIDPCQIPFFNNTVLLKGSKSLTNEPESNGEVDYQNKISESVAIMDNDNSDPFVQNISRNMNWCMNAVYSTIVPESPEISGHHVFPNSEEDSVTDGKPDAHPEQDSEHVLHGDTDGQSSVYCQKAISPSSTVLKGFNCERISEVQLEMETIANFLSKTMPCNKTETPKLCKSGRKVSVRGSLLTTDLQEKVVGIKSANLLASMPYTGTVELDKPNCPGKITCDINCDIKAKSMLKMTSFSTANTSSMCVPNVEMPDSDQRNKECVDKVLLGVCDLKEELSVALPCQRPSAPCLDLDLNLRMDNNYRTIPELNNEIGCNYKNTHLISNMACLEKDSLTNVPFGLSREKCITDETCTEKRPSADFASDKHLQTIQLTMSSSGPVTASGLITGSFLSDKFETVDKSVLESTHEIQMLKPHVEKLVDEGHHFKCNRESCGVVIRNINSKGLITPIEHNYSKLSYHADKDVISNIPESVDHTAMSTDVIFPPDDDDCFDFNITQHLEFAEMTAACLKSLENDSLGEDDHCYSSPHLGIHSASNDSCNKCTTKESSKATDKNISKQPTVSSRLNVADEICNKDNSSTMASISVSEVFHSKMNVTTKPNLKLSEEGLTNGDKFPGGMFRGFSTAGGKHVSVSKSSLERAKTMFSEEGLSQILPEMSFDIQKNVNERNVTTVVCEGFSTASGKKVAVSNSSLEKVRRLFSEEGLLQNIFNSEEINESHVGKRKTGVSRSNSIIEKKFVSSDDVIARDWERSSENNKKFVNIGTNVKQMQESVLSSKKPQTNLFTGFSTASGNKVLVSKNALDKARTLFLENDLSQTVTGSRLGVPSDSSLDNKNLTPMQSSDNILLASESVNMNVNLRPVPSSDSLQPNGAEEHFTCADFELTQRRKSSHEMSILVGHQGFSTASGKKVTVSKRSLDEAKMLFSDERLSHGFTEPIVKSENHVVPQSVLDDSKRPTCTNTDARPFKGFAMTSGKSSIVFETALKNAQSSLSSPSLSTESVPKAGAGLCNIVKEEFTDKDSAKYQKGFTTASGKAVFIPPKALKRAYRLLQDSDSLVEDPPINDFDVTNAKEKNVLQSSAAILLPSRISAAHQNCEFSASIYENVPLNAGQKCADVSRKRPSGECFATCVDVYGIKRARCNRDSTAQDSSIPKPTSESEDLVPAYEQVVPKVGVLLKGECLSITAEEMLDDAFDFGDLASKSEELTELSFKKLKAHSKETVMASRAPRDGKTTQKTLSMEILESTEAFLADEMIDSPIKDKKPCESWLSPIRSHPANVAAAKNFGNQSIPRNSTPKVSGVTNYLHNVRVDSCAKNLSVSSHHSSPTITNGPINNINNHSNTLQTDCVIFGDKCGQSSRSKVPSEIICQRKLAVEKQMLRITKCSKQKILPMPGIRWQKKLEKENLLRLRDSVRGGTPRRLSDSEALAYGIKTSTLKVNSCNAGHYKFMWDEHCDGTVVDDVGIILENGSLLIFDDENLAGTAEFYRALLDTAGVDSKLICERWVANHYRWIIWKLAATEISFPKLFAGRMLTPNEVMLQLQYRYNREIDYSQRSALKKIMERDDTPAKTMVLCIADIVDTPLPHNESSMGSDSSTSVQAILPQLEVTDGWYSIKAMLDEPLGSMVKSGKISIGQKIIVHGAELNGPTDACTPLEVAAMISVDMKGAHRLLN